mmetsp:Transcript_10747/g.26625  ORF Transcript_10747/g.26625 Transcript_10747/m.26625 type:complete len:394 (-) Transcript_10747:204-1385(-)|eukprot:CAMPEP_0173441156 /NCGR_PEP_ID=MMETSP1357-20121228/23807_1 /TAXON_ID=77926 /ORGANISM="Hemiselmis rufescens, Strain PCC563" /LENGTH=393 /DNA_ID=CAMNT_0014406717 /DNA_START=318 /DNA_END=1499 /DNA_ORIENTATION=-
MAFRGRRSGATTLFLLSIAVLLSVAWAQGGSEPGQGQDQGTTRCPSQNQVRDDTGRCVTISSSSSSRNRQQSNPRGMFTYLVAVSLCAMIVFIIRYLFLYRMNQRQLREMGEIGQLGRHGTELARARQPKHKQMLMDDLIRLTNGGESGTLWISVRKKNQTVQPEEMVPIRWRNVRACDSDATNPLVDSDEPLFGAKDQDVAVTVEASGGGEGQASGQGGGRVPTTGVQQLGEACCICLENRSDTRNFPCGHATSCRQCFFHQLCTWSREIAPNCPLCRAPISAITLHSHFSGPAAGDFSPSLEAPHPPQPAAPRPASEHPIAYSMALPPAATDAGGEVPGRAAGLPGAGEATLAADLCFQTSEPPSDTHAPALPVVASVALSTVAPSASVVL